MFNHIEKIRQKPEHVRRRIAVFLTLMLFLVVVFVWIFAPDVSLVEQEKNRAIDEAPSPFWVLKDTLGDSFNDMGSKLEEFKGQFGDGS